MSFARIATLYLFPHKRQENGSKPPSPASLKRIDADLRDRGRRRSSAYSVIDDEDVPLTHKTGTVGIVALALRNRNEKKKEAEFKVRKKQNKTNMAIPFQVKGKQRGTFKIDYLLFSS
mgnify:CR=1 FL=1